jgi:hypothetical protein
MPRGMATDTLFSPKAFETYTRHLLEESAGECCGREPSVSLCRANDLAKGVDE